MITTRFAPSPTGYLHIGNLRAALFNYAIARQNAGCFVLRIDDTDAARSKPEYIEAIQQDLRWLGLDWDRIETQSTRLPRYSEIAQQMRDSGRLYECFETPLELDLKRKKQLNMGKPPVYDRAALKLTNAQKDELRQERGGYWRFLLDRERIEWQDLILGPQSIDAASLSDPVLIRADGQVLYTLASVCDDIDMNMTHVVRGLDHVTNTATQIQIIHALGSNPPKFAHHSMLTGPLGEALSKRLGVLGLRDLRKSGVEPMAILSMMARLGSSLPVEVQTNLPDLISGFDLTNFGASPTKFDQNDLWPLSAKILHAKSAQSMKPALDHIGVPDGMQEAFWNAVKDNIAKTDDLNSWWILCRDGAEAQIADEDSKFIKTALDLLPKSDLDETSWKSWTALVKQTTGRKGKSLFMPLRLALTGKSHGPDMGKLLPLLRISGR